MNMRSPEYREAMETSLLEQFDTDEERAAAKAVLTQVSGVDFDSGLPVDAEGRVKPPEAGEPAEEEGDDIPTGEGQLVNLLPEVGENEPKPEKEKAEAAPAPAAEPSALDTANARIAELEARLALHDSDAELRKSVSEQMRDRLTKQQAEDAAEDAQINEFAETYGDDAAEKLRSAVAEKRALRSTDNERYEQGLLEKARSEKREQIEGQSAVDRAIAAIPELAQWERDAHAATMGDTTKNGDLYNLAVGIDAALKTSAKWADKPLQERFAEAVRLVKVGQGMDTKPPSADDTAAKKQQAAMAAEIAKRSRQPAGLPSSMSQIPSGEAPTDLGARMENITPAEYADLGLSTAQADRLYAQYINGG